MTSPGPPRKRVKVSSTASDENEEQATRFKFNFEELFHVLYGKKESSTVDLLQLQRERKKEKTKTYCVVCRVDRPPTGCPFHEPSSSYTANHDDNSLSYAIKSFPAEVQLCTSTIPGALFGVCAKRVIPEGTWIGPYEGRRVGPEELSAARDNSYVWEIYENGQTSYYIDGSDESTSSWMRFIRCARHKEEQNLYAFQYLGNIFYRSFKEISKGTEMLVWYDEKYPQYLGIPTGLQAIEFVSSLDIAKSSNGDQTSNPIKGETVARTLEDTIIVKENDTKRHVYPESHPRKMTGSSPHRVRHSSYPALTRISGVPHSLGSSPSFPIPNVSSLSSQGTVGPHYGLPAVPIAPPLSSTTPECVYGVGYRPHVPVNISAGIPVGISGRGQLGITGMQTTRVHEEVLDEGPGTISGNSQRSIPSSSLIDNNNPLEKDSSLQINRISFSSTVVASEASNEKDRSYHVENLQPHSSIYTSIRHPTESTADPDSGQCPSLNKIRPSLSNQLNAIEEGGRVAIEKGWNNRSHMTKARSPVDQTSDGTRKSRSHRSLASKEDHVSSRLHTKSPRMTSPWPSEESQSQDEGGGESSDSNTSTKNEGSSSIDEISMWRCRQCQKTFTQRVMLQVHVCPQQPLKPYRCGQCELSFATSTELRSHVETHASEKPFKCGFCSRSFAGATTLNNHIRTHMGKRPFNCEHCGKSFAQAGQLARHQRTPGECETQNSKS